MWALLAQVAAQALIWHAPVLCLSIIAAAGNISFRHELIQVCHDHVHEGLHHFH